MFIAFGSMVLWLLAGPSFGFSASWQLVTSTAFTITVAVAESCSAGALASSLAKAEGAGDALYGGFVTYLATAKIDLLDVSASEIEAPSAVSRPVARAMAEGVLANTTADLALAITGVTGPVPDERGNPRGRVFIAVASRRSERLEYHCEFGPFPPPVLLDAALRTAIVLGREALRSHRAV
ncbi:hypothetical protein ASE66_24635 [Bosea sp. Root483D1]|nr:hypothetical protein ASE66_24635 [Bosea sp. Root483D1]